FDAGFAASAAVAFSLLLSCCRAVGTLNPAKTTNPKQTNPWRILTSPPQNSLALLACPNQPALDRYVSADSTPAPPRPLPFLSDRPRCCLFVGARQCLS